MKHVKELDNFLSEGKKSGMLKPGKKGKISEDGDNEVVRLDTDSGFIEIGNFHDEDGPSKDFISIHAIDDSPQGYTKVKVSDLVKLIKAYNNADWSEAEIAIW